MWILVIILIGVVIFGLIAGFFYNRSIQKKIERGELKEAPEIKTVDEECCGQHEICEKESLLAAVSKQIEYYDDEELDRFKGHPSDNYTEEEIKQAMAVVGKTGPEDELNCSGCGYDTCRDFAIAMLEGRAEENMCVSYMRRIAHDKATVLLQKIPAGVLLVNSELKVVDMNQSCATLMGEDIASIYEVDPGLNGMELKNICSYEDLFRAVLTTGKEIIERQVREEDRTWIISIYNIQPHRLVFGLLQDLREPYVRKEWMLEKTQEVIKKHMETVQQVACLLGENAAFTDATLRSVMEAYKKNDQKKPL